MKMACWDPEPKDRKLVPHYNILASLSLMIHANDILGLFLFEKNLDSKS